MIDRKRSGQIEKHIIKSGKGHAPRVPEIIVILRKMELSRAGKPATFRSPKHIDKVPLVPQQNLEIRELGDSDREERIISFIRESGQSYTPRQQKAALLLRNQEFLRERDKVGLPLSERTWTSSLKTDLIPENCATENESFVAKFEGGGRPG